jgi:hypothetical protein
MGPWARDAARVGWVIPFRAASVALTALKRMLDNEPTCSGRFMRKIKAAS